MMPFIHIRAFKKRDLETKTKAAQAIVKAASAAMDAPEERFTVVFEDVEPEAWEKDVAQAVIEPLRDIIVVENGKAMPY